MKTLFLVAAEKSGDTHGANLMRALKKRLPSLVFEGVGGAAMRSQGLQCLIRGEELAFMGFSDVIKNFRTIWRSFRCISRFILKSKPSLIILIDYPGFNLRLAAALRKKGYKGKIVQMICPSVWAWGKKRIKTMVDNLDLLLTIYPFEKELFKGEPLEVHYIGHPIQDALSSHIYDPQWFKSLGMNNLEPLVAIFPGSRLGEIQRNLPLQLAAAAILKKKIPSLRFGISCGHQDLLCEAKKIIQTCGLHLERDLFFVPQNYTYELMQTSKAAIAKSGTVTLELAMHRCPTVVTYQLSALNYCIARYILQLNLPHYCIVNIVGKETIFPEFIASEATPEKIAEAVTLFFKDSSHRELCMQGCERVRKSLFLEKASITSAAESIEKLLYN